MDLSGCAVLHRQHHAPVHHLGGSIPVAAVPDAVRSEQNPEAGRAQNQLRVAAVDCDEPAAQSDVLEGN